MKELVGSLKSNKSSHLTRSFVGLCLALLPALFLAGPGRAADLPADPQKTELQTRIESGSDLTSRARKVLFRARTHQDAERYGESAQVLGLWLEGHPEREHHLLRFQQALAHLGLLEKERALAALQTAVALEPRFARAWLRLGETAYELEHFELAAEAFGQGYELNPVQRPEFLYYGCVASLMGGQSGRALDDLERLLNTHRQSAPLEWYRALVAAATAARQPGRAERYVQAALADNAEDPRAWDLAYRFAAGREDYQSAAVYLTITGYLRELTRQEWTQLGDLYAVIHVPLQAARSYAAAMEGGGNGAAAAAAAGPAPEGIRAEDPRAREHERLAGAWLAAHRHPEARAALRKALAETQTRKLWSLLGDLDYMAEDYAEALEAYGRGCELDPAFGRGWLMMGYCCRELDRPEEARAHLERAAAFPEQAAGAKALLAE